MKQVAKRFGGMILLATSMFMLISILSCGKKPGGNTAGDPELTLDSLKFGTVDITKKPHEFSVENNVKTVAPNNFTAMFKIGKNAKAEEIKISKVELPAGKTELEAGKATTVTLKVDAVKGKYKEWSVAVNITRKAANGGGDNGGNTGGDPELTLDSLKLGTADVDIKKTPHEVTVENTVKTVAPADFTAMFKISKNATAEKINISKADLPAGTSELVAGKATKVTIKVDAVKGKYKEWKADINVTRKAAGNNPPQPKEDPELTLTKLNVSVENKKQDIAGTMTLFVGKDTKTIAKGDFEAEFNIGSKTDAESITISELVWPTGKTEFDADKITTLTIKVNASKGKYKAWEAKINVFKRTKDQPANGNIIEYSASGGEELTVRYAEKDDEDDENNLIPIAVGKIAGVWPNPYATKVVEGKWIYLRLKPAKGYKYDKFTYKKLTGGSTGLLPVNETEKSDAKGFPKKLKDAGYQARFKMPNIEVEITAHTNQVQTGHKVKWSNDLNNVGTISVQYGPKPHDTSQVGPVFNDNPQSLVPKDKYVYLIWEKGSCKKELKEFKIKAKCGTVKVETDIPANVKATITNIRAFFEMPDCDVEIEAIMK